MSGVVLSIILGVRVRGQDAASRQRNYEEWSRPVSKSQDS